MHARKKYFTNSTNLKWIIRLTRQYWNTGAKVNEKIAFSVESHKWARGTFKHTLMKGKIFCPSQFESITWMWKMLSFARISAQHLDMLACGEAEVKKTLQNDVIVTLIAYFIRHINSREFFTSWLQLCNGRVHRGYVQFSFELQQV